MFLHHQMFLRPFFPQAHGFLWIRSLHDAVGLDRSLLPTGERQASTTSAEGEQQRASRTNTAAGQESCRVAVSPPPPESRDHSL